MHQSNTVDQIKSSSTKVVIVVVVVVFKLTMLPMVRQEGMVVRKKRGMVIFIDTVWDGDSIEGVGGGYETGEMNQLLVTHIEKKIDIKNISFFSIVKRRKYLPFLPTRRHNYQVAGLNRDRRTIEHKFCVCSDDDDNDTAKSPCHTYQ